MRWLRRLFGAGETFEEAYERILREFPPIEKTFEDLTAINAKELAAREEIRQRLDRGGEYQRGIEGLQ